MTIAPEFSRREFGRSLATRRPLHGDTLMHSGIDGVPQLVRLGVRERPHEITEDDAAVPNSPKVELVRFPSVKPVDAVPSVHQTGAHEEDVCDVTPGALA